MASSLSSPHPLLVLREAHLFDYSFIASNFIGFSSLVTSSSKTSADDTFASACLNFK